VAKAEPYANYLHLTSLQSDYYASISSFNFYRPDDLPDAQPTVSKDIDLFVHQHQLQASRMWTLLNKLLVFIYSLWHGVKLNQRSSVQEGPAVAGNHRDATSHVKVDLICTELVMYQNCPTICTKIGMFH